MKNLNEYPTPITDSFVENRIVKCVPREIVGADKMRDLERKLAACREALDYIKERAMDATITIHPDSDGKGCIDDCLEWAEQTLAAIAP